MRWRLRRGDLPSASFVRGRVTLSARCRGGRRYSGASLLGFCWFCFVGPSGLTRLIVGVGCSGGLTGLSATRGVWKAHSTLPGGARPLSCVRSRRKRLSGRKELNAGGLMHDQARPNVVVIVADTFRRDHLGAYGNPFISTPHIDEFARSSVVFDGHGLLVPHHARPRRHADGDFLVHAHGLGAAAEAPDDVARRALPGRLPDDECRGHTIL